MQPATAVGTENCNLKYAKNHLVRIVIGKNIFDSVFYVKKTLFLFKKKKTPKRLFVKIVLIKCMENYDNHIHCHVSEDR